MWIYLYHFETRDERLDVWIDRAVGKISGFGLFSTDTKLTCKLQTRNSECYIGMEKCIFSLQLENLDDSAKDVELVISISSFIELDNKKEKIVLQLELGEKKNY